MKRVLLVAVLALAGCPRGDTTHPIGPRIDTGGGGSGGGHTPEAEEAFYAAVDAYQASATAGWDEASCRAVAAKFAAVAIVEAQYMAGRTYHGCELRTDADAAYSAALALDPDHLPSLTNLGEVRYQAGQRDSARELWRHAVALDPKIVSARVNLALLLLEELRVTDDAAVWASVEEEARDHLSSVLAVDNDRLDAYVLYGLVYMEGRDKNKNRLDLAKLLLDEGSDRLPEGKKVASLEHAYGLYFLYKNNLTEARARFQAAVDLDPKFAEAHQNLGLIHLGFREYAVAKEHFARAIELAPGSYDARIGLGVAQRGLGDLDGAEASYQAAAALDAARGEAAFNLGVLYKDFRVGHAADNKAAVALLKTARAHFVDAQGKTLATDDRDEAKRNVADCDKAIAVYEAAL